MTIWWNMHACTSVIGLFALEIGLFVNSLISSLWGWASEKGTIDLIWIIFLTIGLFCQLSHRFLSDFELKSNTEAWIYLYYMYKQNRNTPSYSILLSRVVICQFFWIIFAEVQDLQPPNVILYWIRWNFTHSVNCL